MKHFGRAYSAALPHPYVGTVFTLISGQLSVQVIEVTDGTIGIFVTQAEAGSSALLIDFSVKKQKSGFRLSPE